MMEIKAIAQTVAKELGYHQLKPEQADIIEAFVKGRDMFHSIDSCYWCTCALYVHYCSQA